jgi:hypothetical protein
MLLVLWIVGVPVVAGWCVGAPCSCWLTFPAVVDVPDVVDIPAVADFLLLLFPC